MNPPAGPFKKMSLATRRAIERGYDQIGPEYYIEFEEHELQGDFAYGGRNGV